MGVGFIAVLGFCDSRSSSSFNQMFVDFYTIVKRGFPVLTWTKSYSINVAVADLVAGITIGLTLIPQCIAYASLAGLGSEYGLYSSLCGGIIYVAFGTVPELNIAPTALLSLLTYSFTQEVTFGNVHAAILLCFFSGIIELLCGVLHLGFLVDFVSTPVVAAFTSAGAITIASSQVKNLLGLNFNAETFIDVWSHVINHIPETRKWDVLLGISCCIILLALRKLKDFGTPPIDGPESGTNTSCLKKLIWFCSVARNAFVVIVCAVVAFIFQMHEMVPFSLTSEVPSGLPRVVIPVAEIHSGNVTTTVVDMLREVGAGVIVIPFIAILGNIAIAKSFAKGKVIDSSQEMIAVGMCNLIGSFFGSYPISASFSRAAVSNASGVKTPLAGIYTSVLVILALTFLTPYFSFIPKATLAAVIICAVIFMVEVALTKMIWNVNKIDLVPFCITLLCCLLLGIEIGILVGVCVDIIFLLHSAARPSVTIDKITNDLGASYVKVTPTSAIFFPSAEYIRDKILQSDYPTEFVVIDCQKINNLDFTSAKCLASLLSDLKKTDKRAVFYQPKPRVAKIIAKVTDGGAKIAETEDSLYEILKDVTRTGVVEINVGNKDSTSNTQL